MKSTLTLTRDEIFVLRHAKITNPYPPFTSAHDSFDKMAGPLAVKLHKLFQRDSLALAREKANK